MKRTLVLIALAALLLGVLALPAAAGPGPSMRVNVLLDGDITSGRLAELGRHGQVNHHLGQIDAVFMTVRPDRLGEIAGLSFVKAVSPDAARYGVPVDLVEAPDFADGMNTWDLDAINVTDFDEDPARQVGYDGAGVYVAVLDTGLIATWRSYLPEERIAEQYATAFKGDATEILSDHWQQDTNGHGTHVTSTIIGYDLRGTAVNGVAPLATIIPVKVLGNGGAGTSAGVAAGITYVGDLKKGPLHESPVVINMSLGGPDLDAVEQAAIDYAIGQGVIIVASAGNEGEEGMGYPGAYGPVISVAASGWIGEWTTPVDPDARWWFGIDVTDPTVAADFYITDFSSRELDGQDLDVAAPGSWIVGPYQAGPYAGGSHLTYYYLGGTSMASPHVAGIVALMLQKDGDLTAGAAEGYLEASAIYLAPGCRDVDDGYGNVVEYCWEADATGAGLATADAALAAMTP